MNFFERILYFLKGTMPTPTNFGWFHIMFIAIVIGATVAICVLFKNAKDKTFRRIVLICWVVILVLEIYKQIIFSVNFGVEGGATWNYQLYAFPYQLCSTPLYLLPFVAFLKDGKVRDGIMSFVSTFSLLGGLAVMVFPNDVFVEFIGINFQTMIHHGLQVVLGIFFMVYNRHKLNIKYFLKSIPVFFTLFVVAFALDLIVPKFTTETFNMWYISPYFLCTLPLVSIFYANLPYVLFLICYVICFILIALLLHYIQFGIIKLVQKQRKRNE